MVAVSRKQCVLITNRDCNSRFSYISICICKICVFCERILIHYSEILNSGINFYPMSHPRVITKTKGKNRQCCSNESPLLPGSSWLLALLVNAARNSQKGDQATNEARRAHKPLSRAACVTLRQFELQVGGNQKGRPQKFAFF